MRICVFIIIEFWYRKGRRVRKGGGLFGNCFFRLRIVSEGFYIFFLVFSRGLVELSLSYLDVVF